MVTAALDSGKPNSQGFYVPVCKYESKSEVIKTSSIHVRWNSKKDSCNGRLYNYCKRFQHPKKILISCVDLSWYISQPSPNPLDTS